MRWSEVRLEDGLSRRIAAKLEEDSKTWTAFVRDAITAYLDGDAGTSARRRRRRGPVTTALAVALKSVTFSNPDAGAIGLAKSLAAQIDDRPQDAKYVARQLLQTLIELRLTPAARAAVLGEVAPEVERDATALDRLRLLTLARRAGEHGVAMYLGDKSEIGREYMELSGDPAVDRNYYSDERRRRVEAVSEALRNLVETPSTWVAPETALYGRN